MGDERIDQRARPVARRRMDDEARRLVDDDERLVLVDDGERDILALRRRILGLRHDKGHHVAHIDPVGGIGHGPPADPDLSGLDQRLEARARQVRQAARQETVQPFARRVGLQFDAVHPEALRSLVGRARHAAPPAVAAKPMSQTQPTPAPTETDAADPASEAVVARMRRISVISFLVMILGVGSVLAVIVYRLMTVPGPGTVVSGAIPAEPGRLVSAVSAENRLTVTYQAETGATIVIYDLKTLKESHRIRVGGPQVPRP